MVARLWLASRHCRSPLPARSLLTRGATVVYSADACLFSVTAEDSNFTHKTFRVVWILPLRQIDAPLQ